MKKLFKQGGFSIATLMVAGAAYAATPATTMTNNSNTGASGFFVSGFGGTNYLQDQSAAYDNAAGANTEYSWGWNAGGTIGIKQNNLSYAAQVTYLDNSIDKVNNTNSSGSNTGWAYLATAQYDFDMGSQWVPFIGAGLGGATMDYKGGSSLNNVSKTSTALAYQLSGGVGYQINENMRIYGEYRHLATTQLSFPDGGTTATGAKYYYNNNLLDLGVTYYFGKGW